MRILNIRRLALAQQLLVAALAGFLAAGAANAEAMRRPLTISGSPATSAVVGKKYSFTPSASGPSGRTLKFSVSHKPAWTTFSAVTGRLVGTPKTSNKGTFSNIVIKVSDGVSTASLAPFSITVKPATTTTTPPPTISGTPPTSATVGTPYSFKPTASDTSGAALSFSAQNMPAWAAFSSATGAISGTPTSGSVGVDSNITISVSAAGMTASLAPFSITVKAATATTPPPTISGTPPTAATVGTAYSFTPTASDGGATLSFSVQNLPSWATFSIATGAITGTPAAANVGVNSDIVISVSNGTAQAALPAFSITVSNPTTVSSSGGTYALPAARTYAWNPGLLSQGGIPSASWPVCNSTPLAPSGGSDDSAAINNLINSCAAGTVVQLAAGTFKVGEGLYVAVPKGVVLRGAGAGKTILVNPLNTLTTTSHNLEAPTDATPIVIVGPGRWVNPDGDARCNGLTAYQTAYMQLLSADATKGSTSVTVADGSIFSAGGMVILDETSGASWQPDVVGNSTSIWAGPGYDVAWQVHKPGISPDDPVATGITPSAANNYSGSGNGSDAACWFSRQDRPQNEIKQVASVSGNVVTFTSPLTMGYLMSQHAELTTYTGSNAPVDKAGVEDLTVQGGGDGALRFENTMYSWAKNIECTVWYGECVAIDNSFRDELVDSYIHDAAWAEPGGAGYAISLADGSSENLIENNIVLRTNKVIVSRSSGAGSVVAYNYMDDGYIATDEGWIEIGLNASHMVGSHMVLFEGNQSFNMDSDDTHGNSTYIVYFRNLATTVRSAFQSDYTGDTINDADNVPGGTASPNGPKRAAGAMTYSYWMSYVGNVLGQPGLATAANGYVDAATTPGNWGPAIWLLGWNDLSPYTVDPQVAATAIRDGNWDSFLGQQTWLTDTSAPLPDSMYLSCEPAFFGSDTWPWLDPTTGGVYTLPAKQRFDAGTPNTVPASGEACIN